MAAFHRYRLYWNHDRHSAPSTCYRFCIYPRPLAYDVSICLNAWCFEKNGEYNATKGMALLEGYRSVRPLSQAELAALPILSRGSALRFFLTRLYDWLTTPEGALVVKKDPLEYLGKLRFHRSIVSPGEYGIEI